MMFQRKVQILSGLVLLLSLLFIGTFLFSPDTRAVREATGVLIDKQQSEKLTKIDIQRPGLPEFTLIKRTGQWYARRDAKEYPVKNERVADFLKPFSKPSVFPTRASTIQAHERLGLSDQTAVRVRMWHDEHEGPTLDLYFGDMDATGKEIYFRLANQNEVKSAEDLFSSYLQSSPQSWYDLRLFPQSNGQSMTPELVQKITWKVDNKDSFSIQRSSTSQWFGFGNGLESKEIDTRKVEAFLRDLIGATGDDFADSLQNTSNVLEVLITLELGDGRSKKVSILSDPITKIHAASVTDTPYTYLLSEWQYNQLIMDAAWFIKTEE